jgi:hypothetical protein
MRCSYNFSGILFGFAAGVVEVEFAPQLVGRIFERQSAIGNVVFGSAAVQPASIKRFV